MEDAIDLAEEPADGAKPGRRRERQQQQDEDGRESGAGDREGSDACSGSSGASSDDGAAGGSADEAAPSGASSAWTTLTAHALVACTCLLVSSLHTICACSEAWSARTRGR